MPVGYQLGAVNRQPLTGFSTPGIQSNRGGPGGNYAPLSFGGAPSSMPGIPAAGPHPGQSSFSYPSSLPQQNNNSNNPANGIQQALLAALKQKPPQP